MDLGCQSLRELRTSLRLRYLSLVRLQKPDVAPGKSKEEAKKSSKPLKRLSKLLVERQSREL